MSARIRAVSTLSALTSLTLLGAVVPAAAAGPTGPAAAAPASAGACGDLKIDSLPGDKLVMSVGQERPLTVTFTAERDCTFNVSLRALRPDGGIEISPPRPVRIATPATYTWRIAGTKPTKNLLVGTLDGSDRTPFMLGVRLPDVEVQQATPSR